MVSSKAPGAGENLYPRLLAEPRQWRSWRPVTRPGHLESKWHTAPATGGKRQGKGLGHHQLDSCKWLSLSQTETDLSALRKGKGNGTLQRKRWKEAFCRKEGAAACSHWPVPPPSRPSKPLLMSTPGKSGCAPLSTGRIHPHTCLSCRRATIFIKCIYLTAHVTW